MGGAAKEVSRAGGGRGQSQGSVSSGGERPSATISDVQMKSDRMSLALGDMEKLGFFLPQCQVTLVRCDPQVPEHQRHQLLRSANNVGLDAAATSSGVGGDGGGSWRRYKCDQCHKHYSSKWLLATHKKIHLDKNYYRCRICRMSQGSYAALKYHLKTHHRKLKRIQCTGCDLSFVWKSQMIVHARQHTGEKPYRCSGCGKRWTCLAGLKFHTGSVQACKQGADQYRRKDNPQARFKCHECQQTFALKEDLSYHLGFHRASSLAKGNKTGEHRQRQ